MPEMEHYERALDWLDRHGLLDASAQGLRPELGLAGTCAWILLREHLSTVRAISADEYAPLGHALSALQDPSTGLFGESQDGPPPGAASVEMLGTPSTRALTGIALQALRALRQRPAHALRVLEGLERVGGAAPWLETLDWTNPVLAAEDVASIALCLVHEAEVEGRRDACRVYHEVLDRLEALQDAKTGLFGVSADSFPWRSLVASDCLIPLFAYVRRPVQRVARIVDSILSLEESDDGLARTRGAARDGLAAIRILILLSRQSTYRRDEVREMLSRSREAIAQTQLDDGGFPEGQASALESRLLADSPSEATAHSLYALWLRVLAMMAIDDLTNGEVTPHTSASTAWPGLGYHRAGSALSEHERAVLRRWTRDTAHPDVPPLAAGQSPVLSVIVPCYNLGLYLHEAIESVLAQTFRGFEIVVVDDGSTDEYTRLLLEHFDRPRTRIVHQENCGLPVARNEGIRQSSGRYVCCLDPDDRLRPEFFAEACKRLDEDPIVGFVSGYFEMFDEGEGVFRYDTCEFPELLVHNRAIEPAVFRRAGWEHVGGYCTSFSASGIEDWDLWIELIEAGYRASVIQETVWDYRIRADQMSAGMYQPGTWGRLVQELVQRHPDSYREHIVAVVAFHATRWADVRGWAAERSAGIGWWQRHAASWERIAAGRERLIQELQARLQTLEHPLQARSHEAGGDA